MSVARQLNQLQDIDLELESAERALAQIMAKIGESRAVVETRRELEREETSLEELKRRQHEAEWAVDDYSTKLASVEEKLYSGRINNPKELASLQRESEILKGQRSRAEDTALELMERVAQSEDRVAALGSSLQQLEKEWQAEQAHLATEAERCRATIARLQAKRQTVADGIDPADVAVYDSVKRQKGRAVARVERGTCRSCGITLSTAQRQQARGNELMRCPNCGRILFHA